MYTSFGMGAKGWVLVLLGCLACLGWAQFQTGSRVGLTAAGAGLPVYERPCAGNPIREVAVAGTDGFLMAPPFSCGSVRWHFVAWQGGLRGWSPEQASGRTMLLPLPGRGAYPNIRAMGAYRVQVAPDGNPLNVRTGPGLSYSVITQKPAGSTGWAYQVSVDAANRLVWWKIRWDDANGGQVGWSADSRLSGGVYLTVLEPPRPLATLSLASNNSGVSVQVSLRDLQGNPPSGTTSLPASLSYVEGTSVTLIAPTTAPDGTVFVRWEQNGTPLSTSPSITLTVSGTLSLRAVYENAEAHFLANLIAPWRSGQLWTPSTYDTHAGGNPLYAVDFNRAASSRATCPYTSGWIQDCEEVLVASHAGRAYTRAQSGCTGYGNYVVVVSNTPVSGSSNTYLATIYAHLNYFLVPNNTSVSAGQPIARLGSTGSSTGPHLHYEVREVTVSGSTLTLGTRRQVLNNPAIRLSGQPLNVDLNCQVSGLGYAGPPITGTVSVGTIPGNLAGTCSPYSCGGFLHESPFTEPDRCLIIDDELPEVLYLTDVNGDSVVDEADLLQVLLEWGCQGECPADVNADGIVDETDLLWVLSDLGR